MNTRTRIGLILSVALVLACPGIAQAAPVTFGFAGTVVDVPADDPGGGIGFGSLISGQYTFDSAALDAISSLSSQGSYTSSGSGIGLSVTIGSLTYNLAGFLNIGISNDIGVDQYTLLALDSSLSVELFLEDLSALVFSSDALPLTPPSLSSFAIRDFHLIDTSFGDVQIDGTIDSLSCITGCGGGNPIPEPGTLALIVAGLLASPLRRRLMC